MNKLLKDLKIDETFSRKPKVTFDNVKSNVFPRKGYNYMADLLYLPKTRQKYLYLLTMVDLWSNSCDFEPIKDKTAATVLAAMKAIFKRGILKLPKASVRTDNGTEFQDVFHKYLYDHNIFHRYGEPYRHQQSANIEKLNYELGRILNGYMNTMEVKTGEVYREWMDIIPTVRKELNKIRNILPDANEIEFPEVKTNSKYKVGDIVYYKSEMPLSALGHKQPTERFRVGDFRYNITDPRKILKILYYPNNVRYILDNKQHVSYAESELKEATDAKYIVKKILDKKIEKRVIYYLIWWNKYPKDQSTLEPRSSLLENGLKELINQFEYLNKRSKTIR